jgi:hypothetical protein
MKFHIPTPCPEDWGKMKIGLTSRFCESCTKDVMDFTKMSRQEILEYLLENQGHRTCGRILPSQLDFTRRDIVVTLHQMKKRYPRHQLPMTVLFIAGMMLAGCDERRVTEVTKATEKVEKENIEKNSSLQIPEKPKLANNSKKEINISIESIEGETMGFMVAEPDPVNITEQIKNLDTIRQDSILNVDLSNTIIGEIVDENSCFRFQNLSAEEYISKKFTKKSSAHASEKLILSFEVGIDGKISNISITQSVSEKLDQYARQLISEMPGWLPAKHNGKKTTSKLTVEITIPGLFEKAKVKVFQF